MTSSQSSGGSAVHRFAAELDQGFGRDGRRYGRCEAFPVDRQGAAGRHLVPIRTGHDQRTQATHLAVDDADRVAERVVGPKRVRTDEFRERVSLVRLGRAHGPHLVQDDGKTGSGDLPGGFAAGEPAADDVDRFR